jgi:hypothetical protein
MSHEKRNSEINHRARTKPHRRNYSDAEFVYEPFTIRHGTFDRGLRHHIPVRGDRIVENGLTRKYIFHRNPFDWYNSRRAIILDDIEEVLPPSQLYPRFEHEPEPYFQQSFRKQPTYLRGNEYHEFSNHQRHHYPQKTYKDQNDIKVYNVAEPEFQDNQKRYTKGHREPTNYKSTTFENRNEYFDDKYGLNNKKPYRYYEPDDIKYKEGHRRNKGKNELSSGNESVIVKDNLTTTQSNYMTFLQNSFMPKNEYQPESQSVEAQMANEFKKRYR